MKIRFSLRIISLLLAVLTLFSLAACSSGKNTQTDTSKPTESEKATEKATDSTEKNDPDEDKKDDKEEDEEKEEERLPEAPAAVFGTPVPTVRYSNPAIPADVGETVDLSKYAVEFKAGEISPNSSIVWSSEEISVSDSKVTPNKKGIYKLTASNTDLERQIYLVVKEPTDDEYVIYYNDFADDSSLEDISHVYASSAASHYIEGGKLVLKASVNANDSIRVILPEWLSQFGNYSISTKTTITEKANESRWMALMYRVQNYNTPYYQLCMRANTNASNGVELAHYTASKSWAYHAKTGYTSAFSPSSLYDVTLSVTGTKAEVYINGSLVCDGSGIAEYMTGAVGINVSGSTAVFDEIKVALNFDEDTNITLAPSVISKIDSAEALSTAKKADIALLTLDAYGYVKSADGSKLGTVSEILAKLPSKTIPAFILPAISKDNADTLFNELKKITDRDVMIVSDNAEDIRLLRDKSSALLGVLDVRKADLSGGLIEARSAANSAGARICLLPSAMATQQNTEFLNTLNISVWYEAADNSATEAFRLITSGANGIVSADPELISLALSSTVFAPNSILRPIGIIGHRGMPSQAPENTIKGSILAAKYGANIIENDIYITTDGVLVVMHDGTIDRTTNGVGNVESMSYAQLCQYLVDDAPDSTGKLDGRLEDPLPIPTLEEYIKTFKDTDTFIFIEIKSSSTDRLVPALKAMLDKYDFYDQCNVICFSAGTLKAVKRTMPELSVGYLCSTSNISEILTSTSNYESSFNPSYAYAYYSVVSTLATRGIFTWPWTVNDQNAFDTLYLSGVAGITTNYPNFAKDYIKRLYTDKSEYTFALSSGADVELTTELYGADLTSDSFENVTKKTTKAEMLIIAGNESLKFDGNRITAAEAGIADVIFRVSFKLTNGATAYVYTQPIRIDVQ
ncbi:MAG: hypothetical protein E7642_03170 [Ruminococcaceae bacterium]|nr:hypothetical protein [Oscillospiraceae bacterium]